MPTIGIVHSGTQGNADDQINAFKHSLGLAGYEDGTDVDVLPELYANDVRANMAQHASDLITKSNVNVLVAAGGSACTYEAMYARQAAGANLPIVFTSFSDTTPPGTNMTGVCARTSELDPRRLELLAELSIKGPPVTQITQIGVLTNSSRDNFNNQIQGVRNAARYLGLTLIEQDATKQSNIGKAKFPGAQALLITADPLFNDNRKDVLKLGPAIYQWSEFTDPGGGLMSYGPRLTDAYKAAGDYVGRVLDLIDNPGALPPVVPLNSFELVINMTLAKTIGIAVPQSLQDLADSLI
jgi:putative ABC transport system substrate-binding protein